MHSGRLLSRPAGTPLNVQRVTLVPVDPGPVRDQADEMADYWCKENPWVDVVTKTLAIRLRRAAHHLERELRRELSPLDMDTQEFEVLLSLRRGVGHSKTAGELMKESRVTSGAITNRVARLEGRGWVRRQIDPSDRRQVLVSLTKEGLRRADRLVATKTETEQRVFAGVDRETLARMSADMRTLLLSLEGPATASREGPTTTSLEGPATTPDERAPSGPTGSRRAPSAPTGSRRSSIPRSKPKVSRA